MERNRIIGITLLLSSFLSTRYYAQHLLEALDAPTLFTSTQTRSFSKDFTRDNCSDGGKAIGVFTYTQNATATSTSFISQEDADRQASDLAYNDAVNLVNTNGQNQANSNSKCLWTVNSVDFSTKTFPGYESAGTNYGSITVRVTSYYTAVSDISFHDAHLRAKEGAEKLSQKYLNRPGDPYRISRLSKPAYICYEEYEEEYITGDGINGTRCPTSRKSTGKSMERESASNNDAWFWSSNGTTGASCTLKGVNWQNPNETRTIYQTLFRFKRSRCRNNILPSSTFYSTVEMYTEHYQ